MTITAHNTASKNGRVSAYAFICKEKDTLRLYLQSGELCRARLTSPPDLLTGYSYFGSRYLDHELMTGWLGVDPMADKYPSLSPYAYCAWNPVKSVDPNGEKWRTAGDSTAANELKSAVKSRMNDISNIIQDNKRKILEIAHDSKMKQNRKARKTSKLNMETDDLSYQLELLSDFLEGIKEIEDDDDIKTRLTQLAIAFRLILLRRWMVL